MHHATTIIRDIVNGRTLSRIKSNTKPPLLPFNQRLVGDSEGRTLRLDHIQWFEILAGPLGQQLWHVFGGLAMTNYIPLESLFK